jgi:hypothetical protein
MKIKGKLCRWVAISFANAYLLKIPTGCAIDSSPSDDLVWLDKRRLARQVRRWRLGL